ncbi:helix-turn-helix domain-containing protein [Myroides sp. BIT-d1]|uniref:Helix-turn-helix domain-containing protein n=1 Tax=Myroides albus TaxID=2562892 RepID=A0A6I3LN06_9FLAO|nr:helix-turn-helix domain-containing protein [Myroides albus]MTG97375.1 helix-turn-helix domain-containing protein [Myroides albus]
MPTLLENTDQPIKEIAVLCGYQYVQHFTTAFKRSYGITPGKIRRK